jgi:hypothetical protein
MTQANQALEPRRSVAPFVVFGLAVLYVFSPVDIIPDIPVVGWVDDGFILSTATLYMVEKGLGIQSRLFLSLLKTLRWIVLILGVIAVTLIAVLGVAIIAIIKWLTG